MYETDLRLLADRFAGWNPLAESGAARARVATWRQVTSFSTFFDPLPQMARSRWDVTGDWAEPGDDRFADLLGLDEDGRPAILVADAGQRYEAVRRVWEWSADGSFLSAELNVNHPTSPILSFARAVDGDLRHVVSVENGDRRVTTLSRSEDGSIDEALSATLGQGDYFIERKVQTVDEATGCLMLWRAYERSASDDGLAELLQRASRLEADTLAWDGRTLAPEPWPGEAEVMSWVPELADALSRASRQAIGQSGVRSCAARLQHASAYDAAPLPPVIAALDVKWRSLVRQSGRGSAAALDLLAAEADGHAVPMDLLDHLSPEDLRRCRVLSTAWQAFGERATAVSHAVDALADQVSWSLTVEPPAGAEQPWICLGTWSGQCSGYERDRFDWTKQVVGEERWTAWLESFGAEVPRARPSPEMIDRSRSQRDALEELLRAVGLSEHAHRLAHLEAVLAARLQQADGTEVGSRLGGPPLLPAGEAWPVTQSGLPLSFLAAIDLAEMRTQRLPQDGWLLFFALLAGPGDDLGFYEVADNTPGSEIRVLHVPVGQAPVPAVAPSELEDRQTLVERRVEALHELTLPDGYDSAAQLGLSKLEAGALEQLRGWQAGDPPEGQDDEAVEGEWDWFDADIELDDDDDEDDDESPIVQIGTEGGNPDASTGGIVLVGGFQSLGSGGGQPLEYETRTPAPWAEHWVDGLVTDAQGDSGPEGSVTLLRLASDESLGFGYLDAGTLIFRISVDDLAAGRWEAAFAEASSC